MPGESSHCRSTRNGLTKPEPPEGRWSDRASHPFRKNAERMGHGVPKCGGRQKFRELLLAGGFGDGLAGRGFLRLGLDLDRYVRGNFAVQTDGNVKIADALQGLR